MSSRTLNQNLIQITRYRFVNAYLVREDDGFTLVDTTLGGGADDLIAAAQAAGGQIRRIALTHGHGDHVGSVDGAEAAARRLDVQVLIPELDARILAGENVVEGKLPGSWPKVQTGAGRPAQRRRPRRQPRGRRQPGPHARSRRVPRHARPHADRRRRVHAYGQRRGHRATSSGASRSPRWPPGTRARTSSPRARCGRSTPRSWSSVTARRRRARRRRWTARSHARGGRLMARAGLDADAVVAAAAQLADADGLEALTLARLAAVLGIRSPSLYAHVGRPRRPAPTAGRPRRPRAGGSARRRRLRGVRAATRWERSPTRIAHTRASTRARTRPCSVPRPRRCAGRRSGGTRRRRRARGAPRLRPRRRRRDPRDAHRPRGAARFRHARRPTADSAIPLDLDESFARLVATARRRPATPRA